MSSKQFITLETSDVHVSIDENPGRIEPTPTATSGGSTDSRDCEQCAQLQLEHTLLQEALEAKTREYHDVNTRFGRLADHAAGVNYVNETKIAALVECNSEFRQVIDETFAFMADRDVTYGNVLGGLEAELTAAQDLNLSRQMTNRNLNEQVRKLKDDLQHQDWTSPSEKLEACRRHQKLVESNKELEENHTKLEQAFDGLSKIMGVMWDKLSPEAQRELQPMIDRWEASKTATPPTEDAADGAEEPDA